MSQTKGRIDRTGSVSFGDASLSIWEEGLAAARNAGDMNAADKWEHDFKRDVFSRVVQTLNRLGWTCVIPENYIKQYGASFARAHRECSKGDLKGRLEVSGRSIKFETWQGVNTPTRPDHGGRYESNKEACMPYVLWLEMERARRRIRDYLLNVFTGYTFDPEHRSAYRRPMSQTAMERIAESYAKSWHFKGDMAAYLKKNGYTELESYNCTSRDGKRIEHGKRVYYTDRHGRVCTGIAYYNINSMWWVTAGKYDIHNVGTDEIWVECPPNPRAKRNARQRRKRLEGLLAQATKAMNFERAALLRDLLFPKGEQLYVITAPDGAYWAPDSCGYRSQLVDAGRYTEVEAKRILGGSLRSDRGDQAVAVN